MPHDPEVQAGLKGSESGVANELGLLWPRSRSGAGCAASEQHSVLAGAVGVFGPSNAWKGNNARAGLAADNPAASKLFMAAAKDIFGRSYLAGAGAAMFRLGWWSKSISPGAHP
ncbi:MAG: hypothetical protein EA381_20045 [Planctomycetaceae bacterium]|nr:MAG: hypothetical protein EA381_20045 [Planctomycetaceae bacterium]